MPPNAIRIILLGIFEFRIPASGSDWTAEYALDQRCCGCRFHSLIYLGHEPSPGPAEIEVTFDDWLSEKVVPARFNAPFAERDQAP